MDSSSVMAVLMASVLVALAVTIAASAYAIVRIVSVIAGVSSRQDAMLRDAHNRILLCAQNQMDRALLETEAAKYEWESSRERKSVQPTPVGYAEPPASRVYNAGEYADLNIVDRTGGPD